MDEKSRTIGRLCPLLDWHGDRAPGAVPVELQGHVRALYAATEVFIHLEMVVAESPARWPRWASAVLRVAWLAGVLAGRASVFAATKAHGR
jgi:hypothetical protein